MILSLPIDFMDIVQILHALIPADVLQVLLSGGVIAAVPVVVQLHIQSKGDAAADLSASDKVWMAVMHGTWLSIALDFLNGDLAIEWLRTEGMQVNFWVGVLSSGIEGAFFGLVAAGGVGLLFTVVSKARSK